MPRLQAASSLLCASAMNGSAAAPPTARGQELVAEVVARVCPSVVCNFVVQQLKTTELTNTQVAKGDIGASKTTPADMPADMAKLTPNVHVGSGFSMAPGLIAANRHVVEGSSPALCQHRGRSALSG